MSPEKKMSKRQMIRAKRQRQARMQRLGLIGAVAIGAVLVAVVLISSIWQPLGEIVTVEPISRFMASGTAMGDPNAPVVIDIFEDFQCSACVYYSEETERRIAETYVAGGQVHYVFHQYPFLDRASVNKESQQAANASMCAMEQDKFWEYHDILFANWNGSNAGAFSDRRLVAFAETLELDVDLFTTCFEENRYRDEIQADFDLGTEMGVSGTPSVFVNGQQITPGRVPGFEDVQQAVEAALTGSGQ
jgi:protein-disulfide isomerase